MKQLIRFALIGTVNTMVGYGVYCLFLFIDFHYTLAALLSTIFGICFNFFTTGRYVFGNQNVRTFPRFVALYGCLYFVGIFFLQIWESFVHSYYLAGLLNIPLMAAITFWLQKRLVFRKTY